MSLELVNVNIVNLYIDKRKGVPMRRGFLFVVILLLGCIGQKEPLALTDITFCAYEPGDRSYQQKLDAVYTYGDTVWMYLECFYFNYNKEGERYTALFDTKIEVYYEDGSRLGEVTQPVQISSEVTPVYTWFKFWIDTIDLRLGKYTVKITVTDTLSGQTAVSEGTFTVEK